MWLVCGLLINIAIQLICAKGHHKHVHKQLHKESVPRFTIPHPSHPESAFIPEATLGNQRAVVGIVGTELPGAYGEDYDMENGYESGSGVVSASGSGSEKDTESPESPGKYGTNLVHNPPPSNPSAAFVSHMNETGEDDEEKEDANMGKDIDEGQSHADSPVTAPPTPAPSKTTNTKKVQKIEKNKATKKIEKHKAKSEKSHKVAKRKSKIKPKTHEENNMISKIDAIAKQIERVEHRERLDRKEAATLKVAKKVAKKVIKNIAAKKKHKKSGRKVHKALEETNDEEEKTSEVSPRKETAPTSPEEPAGPEGFECPWACFWTCHSYCPKECCNNPFKCDLACREFCTPYCSDRCCAPGSQRLPKLQINFNGDEERKNISAIFTEDDKHQNPTNSSIAKGTANEDGARHHMLDPAENSYQQLKEQEHQIAIASQIEALKKATSYAAHLMGLPPECPLACARICLPGLCKQQCCARSRVPGVPMVPSGVASFQASAPIDLHHSSSFSPGSTIALADGTSAPVSSIPGVASNMASPAMVPGPQVIPSRNQLALANQFALARKQQYLLAHNGLFAPNAATAYQPFANANNYMMNKLVFQNRLLEGKASYLQGLQDTRNLRGVQKYLKFIQNSTARGTIAGPASYFKTFHHTPILQDIGNSIEKHNVAGPSSFFPNAQHTRNVQDIDDDSTEKSNVAGPLSNVPSTLYVDNLQNITVTRTGNIAGFKCPWSCFWRCHSYCPKRCCNNPYNCETACGDKCTSQCSDICCAPGLERLATYNPAAYKPIPAKTEFRAAKPIPNSNSNKYKKEKTLNKPENARLEADMGQKAKVEAAKNANKAEKEREDDISFISELEALRKATTYAADVMGLPADCPAACVQICLPGWCKKHCCVNSLLSHNPASTTRTSHRAPIYFPIKTAPRNYPALKRIRKPTNKEIIEARKQHFLALQKLHNRRLINNAKSNRRFITNGAYIPILLNNNVGSYRHFIGKVKNNRRLIDNHVHNNRFIGNAKNNRHLLNNSGNKRFMYNNNLRIIGHNAVNDRLLINSAVNRQIAIQNKLREKHHMSPPHVQYNQLQYNNQVQKQNLLFSRKAQALVQEIKKSHYCAIPDMCPKTLRGIMRTCPKICGLSCVPQCPARCCFISKGLPPIGLSFPTEY